MITSRLNYSIRVNIRFYKVDLIKIQNWKEIKKLDVF